PDVKFSEVPPEDFVRARDLIEPRFKHYLSPHTPETLRSKGARSFLSEDGLTGYVVTNDGEIANVFNHTHLGATPGAGSRALMEAMRLGGRRVEYFNGKLSEIYRRFGCEPREIFPFDLKLIREDFPDYDVNVGGMPSYVVAPLREDFVGDATRAH